MGAVELIAIGTIAVAVGACALAVAHAAREAAETTARRLRAREEAKLERGSPVQPLRPRDLHRRGLKRSHRRARGGG